MKESSKPEKKLSKRALRVRRVRGMQDFLPAQATSMARIARIAENVARLYGFERIATPILEQAQLFRRSLGLASDVVMKEMYAFEDKNDEELCLRPEGTAGAIRALIDGGLTQTLPQRWFYEGPMFRRERPQKGRFRQFHQCGIELLDGEHPSSGYGYYSDIEVMFCAWYFLQQLGLAEKVALKINWIGTEAEMKFYKMQLQNYFIECAKKKELSPESIERLERGNPMRIFDSKNPQDQLTIKGAPYFDEALQGLEFAMIKMEMEKLGIPFTVDRTLVRGLDYYSGLVFEFVEKDATREQAAVLAGGRYDGLCEQLGGHPVRAIGWAAGLERLADLVAEQEDGKLEDTQQQEIRFCFMGPASGYYNIRNRIYEEILPLARKQVFFPSDFNFPRAGRAGYDYGIVRSPEGETKGKFALEKLYPNKDRYNITCNISEDELLDKIKEKLGVIKQ